MSLQRWTIPLIMKRGHHGGLLKHLKHLNETQFMDQDQVKRLQVDRLKKLLVHAFENTEYYRDVFQQAGLDPFQFQDPAELEVLPPLTKNDIAANRDRLVAKNFAPTELHSSFTGGTTGRRMEFVRDNGCLAEKEAALLRFEEWAGWEIGKPMGLVWPAQQDYVGYYSWKARLRNYLTFRHEVFPAAIATEEMAVNYLDALNRKKIRFIRSFAGPMYYLAQVASANNIELKSPLRGIVSTGEPLFSWQRAEIEKVFRCKVYDSYRSREAGPVAQECAVHDGLHLAFEIMHAEAQPSEVDEGAKEILVTDLLNYGMPLIRYRTGDFGEIVQEKCLCGRSGPRIKNLNGRALDAFLGPDGQTISTGSLVLYLIDEAPEDVGQIQVIQENLEAMTIRYTNDLPLSEAVKTYQERKIKDLFGDRVVVSFEGVDEIPREKSGKYRFSICKIRS